MSDLDEAIEPMLKSFTNELVVALINLELHAPQSPLVQDNLNQLLWDMRALFAAGLPSPLRLELGSSQLRIDGQSMLGPSLQAGRLLQLAKERDISEIAFSREMQKGELLRFLDLLSSANERSAFLPSTLKRALRTNGIEHIEVSLRTKASEEAVVTPPAERGLEDYQALADVLQDNHVAAFRGEHLELDRAAGVVEQALANMGESPSDLLALANYDDIDSFTVGHSVRVALLSLQVASATGAREDELLRVGTAALMHDIGKSRIPQEILFKQGPLDQDEWAVMMEHPRLGAEILLEQDKIDPRAIGAAFCHHMTPGNHGYPQPALAFEPSGISKLVRVCDVFEALTSVRPYKGAMTPVEAYVVMHREDRGFDPEWLNFFEQVIGIYPLGTRLKLKSGEQAVVIEHGPSVCQPRVRLVLDADGKPVNSEDSEPIIIGVEREGRSYSIKEIRSPHRRKQDEEILVDQVISTPQHPCL